MFEQINRRREIIPAGGSADNTFTRGGKWSMIKLNNIGGFKYEKKANTC